MQCIECDFTDYTIACVGFERCYRCKAYLCGRCAKLLYKIRMKMLRRRANDWGSLCTDCWAHNICDIKKQGYKYTTLIDRMSYNIMAKYARPSDYVGPNFELEQVEQVLLEWKLPKEIVYKVLFWYVLPLNRNHLAPNRLLKY